MSKNINLETIEKVYFIGIGGIGVSAVAKYFYLNEKDVSGSDKFDSEITDELREMGITVFIGSDVNNFPEKTNLVIYSTAVPEDDPELVKARDKKIPMLSFPQFLAQLSEKKYTIAVTGTHGKSTTTALVGMVLKNAGFEPTVIVGSKAGAFTYGNLEMGMSNILVVEACEYQANMTKINPDIAIVTNIEFDHPDFYENENAVAKAMQEFVNKLPTNGIFIKNYDDKLVRAKLNSNTKTVLYGLQEQADISANNIVMRNGSSYFTVTYKGKEGFGDQQMSLHVPGKFNISNALAAVAVAVEMQVPVASIAKTFENYSGLWRRFEIVGEYNGAKIISDYAHHPTAVKATIDAAREWYPDQKIIVVYQPHQHARTKELFDDFVSAFDKADKVFMSDIYDVAGREEKDFQDISSKKLVSAIKEKNPKLDIEYSGDLNQTQEKITASAQNQDIIIIMGAGDIDTVARNL